MVMELAKLSAPLRGDQINFRVQSINRGGYATLLAYKDARCDMERLDDVCTPFGWRREHSRDNRNCTIYIYDEAKDFWVGKEDCGTESLTEAEKSVASDSFKRAGFNWGIGRELFSYPTVQVKLSDQEFEVNGQQVRATWRLKLKEWKWFNQFDPMGKLTFLAGKDEEGQMRFKWGDFRDE